MTAKEHYDRHLGNFYSWMSGNFKEKQAEQQRFFESHKIYPFSTSVAFDLGAGHGLQAVSLANLGFSVRAVDFNRQLLAELNSNKHGLDIQLFENDIVQYLENTSEKADVITCMGDTLTHLESHHHVKKLIELSYAQLVSGGIIVLSFRDLTTELNGVNRFLPVKSDENRILTCFLEYFPEHVLVHDILHEKIDNTWKQKVSAYPKLRLNSDLVSSMLADSQFHIQASETINRMIYIVAKKL